MKLHKVRCKDIQSPYMLATSVRVDIIVFTWKRKPKARYFEAAKSRRTEGRLHVSLLINRHTHARAELTSHEAYKFLTECLKTSVFTMGSTNFNFINLLRFAKWKYWIPWMKFQLAKMQQFKQQVGGYVEYPPQTHAADRRILPSASLLPMNNDWISSTEQPTPISVLAIQLPITEMYFHKVPFIINIHHLPLHRLLALPIVKMWQN